MDLLLDTHALFWLLYQSSNLGIAARDAIESPDTVVWATLTSAQEIALKIGAGRWRGALDLLLNFDARLAEANVGMIAPTATDYANQLRLPATPGRHGDPYDRLIVAQALARGMVLITADPRASDYGLRCIRAGRGPRPDDPRQGRIVPAEALKPIALPSERPEADRDESVHELEP